MTMSSNNHTVPSVPLDLTNKTRERGGCAQDEQGRHGHTPERQVDSERRCSNGQGIPPPERRDCNESSELLLSSQSNTGDVRGHRTLGAPRQTRSDTNSAGKCTDSSRIKLPIRKRPVHIDQDSNHVPGEQEKKPKKEERRSASPEKETSHTGTDPQRTLTHVRDIQSVNDSQFAYFITGPFFQWPQQCTSPAPLENTERLLADIAAATRQDEDGDTPLHIAVVKEDSALVAWLIEIFRRAHKDIDIFNNLRQTPLHLAVITHQPRLVKSLLDAGADPAALDRNGQTALHLCCEHTEADCLAVILRHYPHNSSPLLEIRNYEGLTPLHLAVQNGDKRLARILLDSGAEINAGDNKSGRSPLIHAVENNSMDMVILLIESGCDVNAQSYSGNTALHSACGRGQIEIVRALLKNGADSSLKNNQNDTAIMVAKNKKVSDVLRGKGTRTFTVKTLSNSNGSLSPGSSNHSPRVTPTPQSSVSLSPVPPVSHSPRSQSGESISERQSPMNSNDATHMQTFPRTVHNIAVDNRVGYGMTLHPFSYLSPSGYDQIKPSVSHIQRRTLNAGSPVYYSPGVQRPPYYSDTQIIFLSGIPVPATYAPPSQMTVHQSRPSSHSSDQSDMSTMSINSEERGVS